MTTLKVTVGESDAIKERARRRIRAAEAGEELDDVQPALNFSYTDLARLLSEKNLELLEAIAEHEPSSMREASKLVDRDFKEVHRNLTELDTLDVIEFREEGRSKRPVVQYDNVEIAIDLADSLDDEGQRQPADV